MKIARETEKIDHVLYYQVWLTKEEVLKLEGILK